MQNKNYEFFQKLNALVLGDTHKQSKQINNIDIQFESVKVKIVFIKRSQVSDVELAVKVIIPTTLLDSQEAIDLFDVNREAALKFRGEILLNKKKSIEVYETYLRLRNKHQNDLLSA